MSMTESSTLMSPSVRSVVDTSADSTSAGTIQRQDAAREQEFVKRRQRWQEIIDRRLIEWGCDPTQLEEDGLETPSKRTIAFAIVTAQVMRDGNLVAPSCVVPDAQGGIVFERRQDSVFESVRISIDGIIDVSQFENGELVRRFQIPDSSVTDD